MKLTFKNWWVVIFICSWSFWKKLPINRIFPLTLYLMWISHYFCKETKYFLQISWRVFPLKSFNETGTDDNYFFGVDKFGFSSQFSLGETTQKNCINVFRVNISSSPEAQYLDSMKFRRWPIFSLKSAVSIAVTSLSAYQYYQFWIIQTFETNQ